MEKQPKQLGLNCSIFESFITENRIYVDKTQHIYNLITAPNKAHFYFVSRPRRFGKSLFISTLKALFSGRKELFDEYWIGMRSDYHWPSYPVIHLDFGAILHGDAAQLERSLCFALQKAARSYGIEKLDGVDSGDIFQALVEQLAKNGKIVLLIDEYDKPLLDNISDPLVIEEIRKILSGFYATVKALEEQWRAIFITGVTKFARTSLFSGLNNLKELSFDPITAELFGYTREELVTYFGAHIDDLAAHLGKTREEALDEMKAWYDGYRFCDDMKKPQMHSPLSIIECLDNKRLSNYWFSTGTPGFLITLLRLRGINLEMHDVIQVSMKSLNVIDINNIPLFTLLVQTGYLTIVAYDEDTGLVTLDYPNREIRESFVDYIMQAFTYTTPEALEMELMRMRRAINNKDFALFCDAVRTLFAGIPYNLHIAKESYYHSLFHFMFDLIGMRPQSEVASSRGRADLVLETADSIIVFELKYNDSAQAALNQIAQKKYYEKYMRRGKAIILVGIAIDFKDKELEIEWVEQGV